MDFYNEYAKYFETTPEFHNCWDHILNLLKDMSPSEENICKTLVQFRISQNKEKNSLYQLLFHVLFVVGINASDALPTRDNVEYLVLHAVWKADTSIDKNSPAFRKKYKIERKKFPKIATKILCDNPKNIFFFFPDWWKQFEKAYFIENKPKSKSDDRLIRELLVLNHKGEYIRGKSQYTPPLYMRKALCRHAADALVAEKVQVTMLFQSPGKADDKKFFQGKFGQTIPPLHIGWTEVLEAPTLYGMNLWGNDAVDYGNAFVRFDQEKINPSSYHRLLKIVPPETAIPLLAYSLFSIIKFFIPGYPSRISADEPFRIVNKKIDKLIFLSLKGEDAEALADAFCGAFSDYGEEYKNIDWRYRVHDGVVIYNKKFKNLNQFRAHELLQDACVLCINPDFERNNQEIILQTDVKLTAEEYQEVREIVEGLLLYFIKLFRSGYNNQQSDHISNAKDTLWYTYSEEYTKIQTLWKYTDFSIKDDLDELYSDYISHMPLTWKNLKLSRKLLIQALRKSVTTTYNNIKKQIAPEFMTTYNINYNASMTRIKQYENKTSRIQKQKHNFLNDIFPLSEISKEFSTEGKNQRNQISKYIYLTSAMRLFCITLQASKIPKEDTEKLMNLSLNIFKTMAQSQENMATPQQVLNQYLSSKITKQHIIPVRTQSDTEISGWYDSKKDLIYLPYKTYFDSINQYWEEQNHISLPYEQKAFQATLSKEGILLTKKNGKTNYNRPDYKIVVAPADSGTQYKETVIKIQVDRLSLGKSVYGRLEELSEIPVKRRSKSK